MFPPLLQSIIERENLPVVSADNLEDFAADAGDLALFVAGDAARLVEVADVAVIFPELLKACGGRLKGAVLAPEDEREIQRRYRFTSYPALIFLRNGQYIETLTKVMDWQEYLVAIGQILAREPQAPPAFEFPAGCGTPASAAN